MMIGNTGRIKVLTLKDSARCDTEITPVPNILQSIAACSQLKKKLYDRHGF